MIKVRSLIGLLALLLLMTVSWLYFSYQTFLEKTIQIDQAIEFDVKDGVGSLAVANQLRSLGYFDGRLWMRAYLWLNKDHHKIKAGRYQLTPDMTLEQVFHTFTDGEQVEYQITLVEGLTFKQVHELITASQKLKTVTADKSQEELLSLMGAEYRHPEGLLFADTYSFHYGYTDAELLKRAHLSLMEVLNEEWETRAENLPYQSPYEALIMASIIEKETAVPSERDRIAGVFIRRLAKRMRLQTDPTVIYGIGESYDGDIKRIHLKTDTPYNTYTRHGLPPTPIAIVGREAIHAALNPADGTELYFVAKGDGSHHFSDTLEEHNKAVRKYILGK
ncbi:endolytic transglycosylase MltG [Pleionea sediminis]|uniref:endolytic transglycosylase MltG n=1 Tax=Pleionea sediminis TaxID=2569479 RepID=UPI001185FA22|nr:endolytic transglycosylase MltG [Pleionea sediminis]